MDSTDISREEKQRQESLENFNSLFQSSDDSIIIITLDGTVIDLNKQAAQRLGKSRDDIIGACIYDFLPAGVAASRRKYVEKALRDRTQINFEDIRQGRYFDHTIYPVIDSHGTIRRFILIGRDIEERKRTEQALKESEGRFAAFMRYLPGAAFLKKSSGQFVFVNETWERVFQRKGPDIYGKNDDELWPEEIAAQFRTNDKTVMTEKIPLQFVQTVPQDDGLHHWYTVKFPIFDDSGDAVMLGGVAIDVTKRENIERELQKTEKRFKLLVDTMNEGTAITDSQGVIRYANNRTCVMLGYAENDLIGRSAFDLLDTKNRGIVKEELLKRSRGQSGRYEVSWTRKDSSHCHTIMSAVPLFSEEKTFDGSFVVITDITDRKKAEDELKNYREHLEELVGQRTKELSALNDQLRQSQKLEAVGLLAGGIAHDFSNILTTIKGSMHIIQKKLDNDSPLMKYAGQVLSSVGKASNLAQSLLAFSRKQTVALKPLDFNDIIRSAAKLISQLIGEHIELSMTLTDRNSTVMTDRSQIEQILLNLATNARDSMPRGGTLTVRTEIVEMDEAFRNEHGYGVPGQYVLLTVSDTGTGMDEETKGKIFEPFFTTKDLDKGSGLGLAVTYGIVKQHGGYIDLETVPLEGTTFKIYIPVVETAALRPEKPDVSSAAGKGEIILLAEDDADAREIMAEVLRLSGYKVIEAEDGEDAIRLFRDEKDGVDIVVLDVRMPKKDGREVYEEIMKARPETAVLFMSGYTKDIIDSQRIIEHGLHFISKAASPEEMLTKIREVLDKH
jgi:PAS domain S-box-containing protein